ncbi:MAG TPA: hypothetical protein VEM40_04845 [Nitrospirota bacterium]|nr:hypothetical protein [Nitrospirota bacterium]
MNEARVLIMDDEAQEQRRIGDFLLQRGSARVRIQNSAIATLLLTEDLHFCMIH